MTHYFLIACVLLLSLTGCEQDIVLTTEERLDLAFKELGNHDYNSHNIKYLLFLHRHVDKQLKQDIYDTLQYAKTDEREGKVVSAEGHYFASLEFYPTTDALMSLANIYLERAQMFIRKDEYTLDSEPNPSRSIKEIYNDALFYYNLAEDFSLVINEALPKKNQLAIVETKNCIRMAIRLDKYAKKSDCKLVSYPYFKL